MSIEGAIFSRLSGHGGLAALVIARIYPDTAPQGAVYPLVTYQLVSDERVSAMGADTPIVRVRWQFDVWGLTKASAIAVREQLRLALQRWRGTEAGTVVQDTFIKNMQSGFEPDVEDGGLHRFIVETEIIYEE